MEPGISELKRRPYRYYYQDGLVEIGIGLLFGVVGVALSLWIITPAGSPFWALNALAIIALPLAGAVVLKAAVGRLKDRLVYPRTGYVDYQDEKPSRGRWLIIAAALLLTIGFFFVPDRLNQMSLAEGLLLAIVLGTIGYRVGVGRFYLLASIAAAIGVAAALLVPFDVGGSAATFGALGLVLMGSGACALRRYLVSNPAPSSQAES